MAIRVNPKSHDQQSPVSRPSPMERARITFFFLSLITPDMSPFERQQIKETISALPLHERTSIINCALRLMTPNVLDHKRITIVKAIQSLPAEERELTTNLAHRLTISIVDSHPFAGFGEKVIDAVFMIPFPERESITNHVLRLIPDSNPHFNHPAEADHEADCKLISRGKIIESVFTLPVHERESATKCALRLLTPDMDSSLRTQIIQKVFRLPNDKERISATNCALRLITSHMDGYDRGIIINTIFKLSNNTLRHLATNQALNAMNPHMATYQKIKLIQRVFHSFYLQEMHIEPLFVDKMKKSFFISYASSKPTLTRT